MVGMGAGFTMLNNLGQMVEALGGRREGQGIYVLLFTTLNTVGRMVGGYVPEKLLHARGTPRYGFHLHAHCVTGKFRACPRCLIPSAASHCFAPQVFPDDMTPSFS